MLHITAEPLLPELMSLERRSIERIGRPLHAREVYGVPRRQAADPRTGKIGYLELSA